MSIPTDWWHLAVAIAVGLLVGLERERSGHESVGARTFGIAGLIGGVSAAISPVAAAAAILTAGILAAVARFRDQSNATGNTTEIALVAVVGLGALSWTSPALAVGAAVAMLTLLWAKKPIHHLVEDLITDSDERDALIFFVAAFIILPLAPDIDLGPFGALNPHRIWTIVVLLTATGWLGYVASRILGPRRGLAITGLAGGFVSASATTAAMAHRAKDHDVENDALAAAILASLSSLALLSSICWFVSPRVFTALIPSSIVAGIALVAMAAAALFRHSRLSGVLHPVPRGVNRSHGSTSPRMDLPSAAMPGAEIEPTPGTESDQAPITPRPFDIKPVLLLTAVLTIALLLGRWGADAFGTTGLTAVSALIGLADSHAAALAAAQLEAAGSVTTTAALFAIAAALAAQTIVKMVLAFVAGGLRIGARFTTLMCVPVVAFTTTLYLTTR
jgi:uncharacterized membrane protein (DUF4010 family)